jgi:anti-anti-sigma regulatory factor
MQVYVSKEGQRYGPYSLEELRKEVQANVFRPEHFASIDNCGTWEPISFIPGIGPLIYAVEVDPENQLLTIRYRGYVRPSAVARCAKEVKAALAKLKPGFRILVDLTELESMETDCAPQLREIMELCGEKGVALVVRAIPNPRRDIGLGIMSYFHYGPSVQIATCRTIAEAKEIIARQGTDST